MATTHHWTESVCRWAHLVFHGTEQKSSQKFPHRWHHTKSTHTHSPETGHTRHTASVTKARARNRNIGDFERVSLPEETERCSSARSFDQVAPSLSQIAAASLSPTLIQSSGRPVTADQVAAFSSQDIHFPARKQSRQSTVAGRHIACC